jgi:alkylhydroperoxidase family enzyme
MPGLHCRIVQEETRMARVRLNQTADVAESHRWLFERLESRGGLLNIFRAMSHSPEALLRFMRLGSYLLEDGKVDPKLRELAILRVGWLTRSEYEFSQHIAFGRRVGLTDAQIAGVGDPTQEPFDERERAVLAYAGELTVAAAASNGAFDAVRGFMDEEQIVELTIVIGFYNMVARVLNGLEVDVDPPARRDLDALNVDLGA